MQNTKYCSVASFTHMDVVSKIFIVTSTKLFLGPVQLSILINPIKLICCATTISTAQLCSNPPGKALVIVLNPNARWY